jgi:hypothetical protein
MIAEFFVDTLLHQPLVVQATTNDQMETRLKLLYSPTGEYNKTEIFKMAASRFVEVY